jgi:hypothetical protein
MASVETHWWGFYVKLSHREVCVWTSAPWNTAVDLIGRALANPIATAVIAIVKIAKAFIRSRNEQSAYKGVKLKFLWPASYIGVSRRGFGPSKC